MTKGRLLKRLMVFLALLAAIAVALAAWLILDARKTPTGIPQYVALGSSYAAGAGLGPRQPGSPRLCQRSDAGYPPRLARKLGLSLVDMTCSGSVTAHVLVGGQFYQEAQIRTLRSGTRLVTLTAGGNDVGFVRDLYLMSTANSDTALGWAVRKLWGGPPPPAERDFGKLQRTLTALLREIRRRSPRARIVVATYPAVLPPTGTCPQLRLSASQADVMRQVQAGLAAVTRMVGKKKGAIVVDMTAIGADHSACSATPWTKGWGTISQSPFHPNREGAKATAGAIVAALGRI
ncbi:SGNH/GDSL hydrolase family protein [Sphingomonas mollis]|uniref:SGNH/GDSL hydrolase family protein n=1 Tax=Sphingomonas mollis TaxID=2795726 RepID=A0ABS0XUM5_9SPHN|nr:SGNH/GDSL hydrolase family protein [Sphingomonas sp. BT553]MBJ6123747.1 SGNH/GDSL hydrolase family protein [Sphingomonas sp. BT553]